MSTAVAKVARLKPVIRLGQAISEFQADLSPAQKAVFHAYQRSGTAPSVRDVMHLTAEINLSTGPQGRCFGPRLTNILQAVQEFAALGDIVLGGTQHLLACGVWGIVRMVLLSVVKLSSYFDRLSFLLMTAGRSAPRYQAMGAMYPKSERLESYMLEYFITVVDLCHHALRTTRSSTFGQWISTLTESSLDSYSSDLNLWACSIKEEVDLLTAQQALDEVKENTWFRSYVSRHLESQSYARQLKSRQRLLEACSAYNVEDSWKQIRKCGNTTIMTDSAVYKAWLEMEGSNTLICTGKLGAGKTVLLANIIDDISLYARPKLNSLTARSVIGSLVRQLLQAILDPGHKGTFLEEARTCNIEDLVGLAVQVLPSDYRCKLTERKQIIDSLRSLQDLTSLSLCMSLRTEPSRSSQRRIGLRMVKKSAIPDDNPDIDIFINAKLDACLEDGSLIRAICLERTDGNIRKAMADIPDDLSGIYRHILARSRPVSVEYQTRILELAMAACRPLTTDEMREALGVVSGHLTWDSQLLLNDMTGTLASCGGLLTIDEEDFTVRMVHHNLSLQNANRTMAEIVLSRVKAPRVKGESVASAVLSTTISSVGGSRKLALKLLRSKKGRNTDIGHTLLEAIRHATEDAPAPLVFYQYASNWWQEHIWDLDFAGDDETFESLGGTRNRFRPPSTETDRAPIVEMSRLLSSLFQKININTPDSQGRTPLLRAAQVEHGALVDVLVANGADDKSDKLGMTPLLWAVGSGNTSIAKSLLKARRLQPNNRNQKGRTPLILAIQSGNSAMVRTILDIPGIDANAEDSHGWTALLWAVARRNREGVTLLFSLASANPNIADVNGDTPLHAAAEAGDVDIAGLLVIARAELNQRNKKGMTPFWCAANVGKVGMVAYMLGLNEKTDSRSEDIILSESEDNHGRTPLCAAAGNGHETTVRLLIEHNVAINHITVASKTPLWEAAEAGHASVVLTLTSIEGVDVNYRTISTNETPLWIAAYNGHADVVKILSQHQDVDLNAADISNITPLRTAVCQGHTAVVDILAALPEVNIECTAEHVTNVIQLALAARNIDMLNSFALHQPTEVLLELLIAARESRACDVQNWIMCLSMNDCIRELARDVFADEVKDLASPAIQRDISAFLSGGYP
ncbi:ankyrin repeat-containing domain protein [Aspergillus karnatakaensis]|uniref:ankyrin repeat domain-containing protein n=1 Tax=Aspergillus karnatakaensis TaxID=1810916 RepID=UPI003CCC993A